MQFHVSYATDIGRKRTQNQDNVAALPELGLFVVADGMGGHRGGETASAMAAEIISETIRKAQKKPNWVSRNALAEAIQTANKQIFQRACKQNQLQGMGTTATALLFRDHSLIIGHVGDSRCYYFRENSMWQITRDHSLVQEKLRAGLISRAEVKTDRMKNVITRSVGFESEVNVEIYEMGVKPGDIFLTCSDGLSGLVEDPQILSVTRHNLTQSPQDVNPVQKTVESLIQTANNNGGDDNITIIMIQLTD